MKILWITNIIFPEVCIFLKINCPVSGGWMYELADLISGDRNIELAVATTWNGEFMEIKLKGVHYFLLPSRRNRKKNIHSLEVFWKNIDRSFQPDLCHIHGTENTHGLACMRACPELNYVISIQGLISVFNRYFYTGIKPLEVVMNITIRDILLADTIFQGQRKFEKHGPLEQEYIKTTKHIIGRTSWDYAHVKLLNPSVEYHFCNEVLRKSFYGGPKWDIDRKVNYSIFISQSVYPLKGMHQVLKAVALLKSKYPAISIRVAGQNITKTKSLSDKIRLKGYGLYIKRLINNLKINENVIFLGSLNELEMVEEYRNAHIFICPSSIENSPNSLGEAQIVGAPCIASYVGGIPDMVINEKTGLLYRFEEIEMLAINIDRLFSEDVLAKYISSNEILAAAERHNKYVIKEQILKIYEKIISS